jgi:hypothetical protein
MPALASIHVKENSQRYLPWTSLGLQFLGVGSRLVFPLHDYNFSCRLKVVAPQLITLCLAYALAVVPYTVACDNL